MLAEVINPIDLPDYVGPRQLQRSRTQRYHSFATISWVLSIGQPALTLEIGYRATDGRYGNSGHRVQGSHGASPPCEAASGNLIHNPQLIERTVASVFLGQLPEQSTAELYNGLRRYVVWCIAHNLLPYQRNSR